MTDRVLCVFLSKIQSFYTAVRSKKYMCENYKLRNMGGECPTKLINAARGL